MNIKYLKLGFVIFFLLLYVYAVAQQNNGNISTNNSTLTNSTLNTGTINYNTTRNVFQLDRESISNIKKISEISKIIAELSSKVDTAIYQLSILPKMRETSNNSNDSTIVAKNAQIEKLILDRQLYIHLADSAFSLLSNKQKEIESKRWLPFGVYQFATKQTGRGILFAGTQIGLLGASVGYGISANNNFNKHKNNEYEQWERDRFYEKYENHLRNSRWFLAGAVVMIGLNYCDNFNWFRKNNIELAAIPIFDWQVNPQMAMTFSINF